MEDILNNSNPKHRPPILTIIFILAFAALNTYVFKFNQWIFLPILIFVVISFHLLRIRRRGYFWIDKSGNKISIKDFLKRWGRGIEGITPLQQAKTNLMGTWIVMSGLIAGLIVNALVRIANVWWWLEIILVGSFIITGIGLIGAYQKYRTFKRVEEARKEAMRQMAV